MAITPFSDNYLAKISYHSSQWLFLCYEKILKYITFYFQWLLLYIYLLKSYSESQFQRPHLDISPLSLRNFKDSIRKFFDLIRINFHLPHKVREIGSTFFFLHWDGYFLSSTYRKLELTINPNNWSHFWGIFLDWIIWDHTIYPNLRPDYPVPAYTKDLEDNRKYIF